MTNEEYLKRLNIKDLSKVLNAISVFAEDIVCSESCSFQENCEDCFEKWLRKEHDDNETYFL